MVGEGWSETATFGRNSIKPIRERVIKGSLNTSRVTSFSITVITFDETSHFTYSRRIYHPHHQISRTYAYLRGVLAAVAVSYVRIAVQRWI